MRAREIVRIRGVIAKARYWGAEVLSDHDLMPMTPSERRQLRRLAHKALRVADELDDWLSDISLGQKPKGVNRHVQKSS